MSFEYYSSKVMDIWFLARDSPAETETGYAKATLKDIIMPEFVRGF
jgi:hypothetical protein